MCRPQHYYRQGHRYKARHGQQCHHPPRVSSVGCAPCVCSSGRVGGSLNTCVWCPVGNRRTTRRRRIRDPRLECEAWVSPPRHVVTHGCAPRYRRLRVAQHRIAVTLPRHSNGRWTAKPVTVWYDVKPGRQSIPDVPLHVLKHKKLDTAQAGWGKVDTDAIARHVGATCWRPCTHTSASRTRRSPRHVGVCAARRVEAVPRGRGCVPHGTGVVDGGGMRDGAWNGHVAASVCPLLRAY